MIETLDRLSFVSIGQYGKIKMATMTPPPDRFKEAFNPVGLGLKPIIYPESEINVELITDHSINCKGKCGECAILIFIPIKTTN